MTRNFIIFFYCFYCELAKGISSLIKKQDLLIFLSFPIPSVENEVLSWQEWKLDVFPYWVKFTMSSNLNNIIISQPHFYTFELSPKNSTFIPLLKILNLIISDFWVRDESHIDFCKQSVTMTQEGGGLSLMTFRNSEKLSNFKAHELSWTVKKFGTRILRVSSSCPPIAHIHRWILWFHRWNHPSAFFGSKMKHKQHKKTTMKEKIEYKTKKKKHTHTHIYKRNKQRKIEIVIISNDNFKYWVISKFTVF